MYYVKGELARLEHVVRDEISRGRRVGVMMPAEQRAVPIIGNLNVKREFCGKADDVASIAHDLYACLRRFDNDRGDNVDVIIAHGFPSDGLGAAIMNRVLKASTRIIE